MHVGTQQFNTSDEDLEYLARHGVFNKNENFIAFHREYGWDVEELVAKKEKCARFGINMEMVALPIHQFNVNGEAVPNFMMGNYEEGDKEIELVINMVRQAAEAGNPSHQVLPLRPRKPAHRKHAPRSRRLHLQHLGPRKGRRRYAALRQTSHRSGKLASHHVFLGKSHSGRHRVQGSHGLPSLRPLAAARLSGRRSRDGRL